MNIEHHIDAMTEGFVKLRRDHLRTLARLKALEAIVRQGVKPEYRAAWDDDLKKATHKALQILLESLEKQSPEGAAFLDDRVADELKDLE